MAVEVTVWGDHLQVTRVKRGQCWSHEPPAFSGGKGIARKEVGQCECSRLITEDEDYREANGHGRTPGPEE